MTNSVVEPKPINAYQLSKLLQLTTKKYSSTIFLTVIDPQLAKITGLIDLQLKSLPMFQDCVNKSELSADDMAIAMISKIYMAMEIFDDYVSFCNLNPHLLAVPKETFAMKVKECEKSMQTSTLKNDALNYYRALEYSSLMDDFIEALKLTRAALTQSLIEKNIASGPAQNKVVYFALKLDELLVFSRDTFSKMAANAMDNKVKNRK